MARWIRERAIPRSRPSPTITGISATPPATTPPRAPPAAMARVSQQRHHSGAGVAGATSRGDVAAPWLALITSRIVFLDRLTSSTAPATVICAPAARSSTAMARRPRASAASREVFGACGGAFMIRRDAFEALGGFDERFFVVYEDVDLSYRARLAGAPRLVRGRRGRPPRRQRDARAGQRRCGLHGQRNLEWTWIKNTPAGLLVRGAAGTRALFARGRRALHRQGRGAAAIRGKLAALAGLPHVLAQRRAIQRARIADVDSIGKVIERGWLARKWREKQL